ncbi:hypothetical protein HMPREF0765_2289 [Sphingobacterium spiritivorum ATCC 33300]|uniref:Tetratricopeptide repeat protein n=1 Tax=Sphingobacterium spiritivorum ATCC 33300 TaxID=525372 RepID=C2FY83_SPHSI|nr:tetratricopeptide repeat protein [Sphingobacterium spiritivorum]EEI92136.1 hypothetical protein HMPREF0765_2289 [Sphingobacterium spiritivorum ATCC 33300]QQS96607.1 tetratricopeptide repeat protein [Sphingobacterium spiritivorum]
MDVNLSNSFDLKSSWTKRIGKILLLLLFFSTLNQWYFLPWSYLQLGQPNLLFGTLLLALCLFSSKELSFNQLDFFLLVLLCITILNQIQNPDFSYQDAISGVQLYVLYFLIKQNREWLTMKVVAWILLIIDCYILVHLIVTERIFYHLSYETFGLFENHTILAIFLAVSLPFVATVFNRPFWKFLVLITINAIVLSYSRTAFAALFISFIGYHILWNYKAKFNYILLILLVLCIILLFAYNVDSVYGRLLIWKICISEINYGSLVLGNGSGFLQNHYLDLQSSYFSIQRPLNEQLLAGQVHSPFNEGLRILIEHGIFVFGLVLYLIVAMYRQMFSNLFRYSTTFIGFSTFVIISAFSYPLSSSSVQLILVITLAFVNPSIHSSFRLEPFKFKGILNISLLVLVGFVVYYSANEMKYLRKWVKLRNSNYQTYNESLYLETAISLYPKIKDYPKIAHEYANTLYQIGLYADALEVANAAKELYSNLQITMLLAVIHEKLGNQRKAEAYLKSSIAMVPKLYYPKYLLFKFYQKNHQHIQAKEWATLISKFPIKVDSKEVQQMKQETKEYLLTKSH